MDFETTLTVIIVIAIPTFVFVLAKLILMARQEGIERAELESGVYELECDPAATGEFEELPVQGEYSGAYTENSKTSAVAENS